MKHPYRVDPTTPTPWQYPAWLEHVQWAARCDFRDLASSAYMLAVLAFMIWVGTIFGSFGCVDVGREIQIHTADSVAEASNAALPILVERYRDEGFRELERIKREGGTAEDAFAATDKIKARWKPIWAAWEALRVAQDAWADALEAGGNTSAALVALKKAYCGLRAVWPEDIPVVPLAPLRCAP